MLKFFRRIRQKLINQGNFKRYLTYAIGEILLVMIGILLALQVNQLNQNHINQNIERKALVDLKNEFTINKIRIETKLKTRIEYSRAIDKYLNLIVTGDASYDDLIKLHSIQKGGGHINLSNGVLNTLISTGNLNLIRNDSLKYVLADWANQMENMYENETIYSIQLSKLEDYNQLHFPHRWYDWPNWSKDRLEQNYKTASNDIVYWNRLVYVQGTIRVASSVNEEISEKANLILEILNNELDN